jgi:DNA-binding MarR family transcriptional regulator
MTRTPEFFLRYGAAVGRITAAVTDLKQNEILVLAAIEADPGITGRDLAAVIRCSRATAAKTRADLVRSGWLLVHTTYAGNRAGALAGGQHHRWTSSTAGTLVYVGGW